MTAVAFIGATVSILRRTVMSFSTCLFVMKPYPRVKTRVQCGGIPFHSGGTW
jgi:hypothetical protein